MNIIQFVHFHIKKREAFFYYKQCCSEDRYILAFARVHFFRAYN